MPNAWHYTIGQRRIPLKRYLCPAGEGLSLWCSDKFGYIIHHAHRGGGYDVPVFSVSLPLSVAGDEIKTAIFTMEEFISSLRKTVESVVVGRKEAGERSLHDTSGPKWGQRSLHDTFGSKFDCRRANAAILAMIKKGENCPPQLK